MMKKKTLVAVALLLITVTVVSVVAAGYLLEETADDGREGDAYGIKVRDDTRRICRDVEGMGGWETDQLFDSDVYYMAWTDHGKSEKVGVSGALRECQFATSHSVGWLRYAFYVSTPRADNSVNTPRVNTDDTDRPKYDGERDGRRWDVFKFPSDTGDFNEGVWLYDCGIGVDRKCDPSGWGQKRVLPSPLPFKIEGREYLDAGNRRKYIHDGSVLRVELQVVTWGHPSREQLQEADWSIIAIDEARIRSAIPEAEWERGSYKVGETARLRYDLPFLRLGGEPAYYVTVEDLNTHVAVEDKGGRKLLRTPITDLATDVTGVIEVPVTAYMFAEEEPCTNALLAIIYSPILAVDEDSTSVLPKAVLSPGAAPTVKQITFDKQQYNKGDTATVTAEAEGNVTKWTLSAQIEGEEVLPLTTYKEAKNRISTSFVLAVSGLLEVEARAYTLCIPSETYEVRMDVGREFGPYCLRNPSDPLCVTMDITVPAWVLLAIAAMLGFVAGLIAYGAIGDKLPWYGRLVVAVMVALIVIIVVYLIAMAIAKALDWLTPWMVVPW